MMTVWVILGLLVAGMAYIRLAPSDVMRWHVPPEVSENKGFSAGVKRLIDTGPDGLARLDKIARATPRTQVLAGSVDAGMVTYITRSAVFGFPDYTTVQQDENRVQIHARLRFGRSDLGVNRARIDHWITTLQP